MTTERCRLVTFDPFLIGPHADYVTFVKALMQNALVTRLYTSARQMNTDIPIDVNSYIKEKLSADMKTSRPLVCTDTRLIPDIQVFGMMEMM